MRRAAAGLAEQAEVLEKLAEAHGDRAVPVFTGMGGSYHVCYAPVTRLAAAGVSAWMLSAAELLHFRLPTLGANTTLIAVSQSGESAEVVSLAERLKAAGGARPRVLAITNGLDNPLARLADLALDTRAGEEGGVSTKTFSAALVVLGAVAEVLAGVDVAAAIARTGADTEQTAGIAARLLSRRDELGSRLASWMGSRSSLVLLGRGCGRAASEMGALTLKEAARFPAEALEAGQFRHGPLELAGPGFAAIVVATDPPTRALDVRLAADLAAAGAKVLLIGPGPSTGPEVLSLSVGSADPTLAPAAAIVPIQILAWRLAVDRGQRSGAFLENVEGDDE
jgi:glucosamine--fructose-6-phosphate aminotransferase (isomerizing)